MNKVKQAEINRIVVRNNLSRSLDPKLVQIVCGSNLVYSYITLEFKNFQTIELHYLLLEPSFIKQTPCPKRLARSNFLNKPKFSTSQQAQVNIDHNFFRQQRTHHSNNFEVNS